MNDEIDDDGFAELTLYYMTLLPRVYDGIYLFDPADEFMLPWVSIFRSLFALLIGGLYFADLSLPTGPRVLAPPILVTESVALRLP